MGDQVLKQLEKARKRLLDLTKRNRLLNFRPTKRTTIRIVDELPDEVWKILVDQGKSLSFLAREEHELFEHNGESENPDNETPDVSEILEEPGDRQIEIFELPELRTALDSDDQSLPRRYTDLFLQTALPSDELQTNLLRIYQAANSALEERGVNLLFLAVGFLEWREQTDSERILKAPLVLVPVKLERTSARRRFKISALSDELVVNPCLMAKLQNDYRINLPQPPEDWSEFDIDAFLESVEDAVSGADSWTVKQNIYLGFFSFVKYLMYLDLDPDRWPEGNGLLDNSIIRAMCGSDSALNSDLADLPNLRELDEKIRPEDAFQVLDADSSQLEAILVAKHSKSIVIEGPPGTGKSQTIANIIAECLADGKTILFVSAKMAALEVVKRRLDGVGLGDFCLELHSTKANRKAVAKELQYVLEKGRCRSGKASDGAQKLQRLKKRLNGYVKALHKPFGPCEITPYQAMGRIALLDEIPDVNCRMPGYESWTSEELEDVKELIKQLSHSLEQVFPPSQHPWRDARLRSLDTQSRRRISEILEDLSGAFQNSLARVKKLAELLDTKAPTSFGLMKEIIESGKLLISSPEVAPRLIESDLWDEITPEIRGLLQKLIKISQIRRSLSGRYKFDIIGSVDWKGIKERFTTDYTSIFRRCFSLGYWSDRKSIKQAKAKKYHPTQTQLLIDLETLISLQELCEQVDAAKDIGFKYFDKAWTGSSTEWSEIKKLASWLKTLRELVKVGAIGLSGIKLAAKDADRTELREIFDKLIVSLESWKNARDLLVEAANFQNSNLFNQDIPSEDFDAISMRLECMANEIETLFDWAQFQDSLQTCQNSPLTEFVQKAFPENLEPDVLSLAMEKQFLRLLMKDALVERDELRQFNGLRHEDDRLEFAKLDRQWVKQTSVRLKTKLAAEKPAGNFEAAQSSQIGILQGEVRRRRGGRSIRRLLRDSADVIQKLKPCLMMSPLSVAQFINPEGMRFDVVVFDEASQVEPADALGAIARGQHLLLVGDPNQLPPTTFFNSMGGESDYTDDEEVAGLSDMESILDRGSMILPRMRLRWHYRSKHESLIAFSNREFYDNSLVVFPSSHADTDDLGLSMQYEPSDPYDRGRGQTNRQQAKRIATQVFEHAKRFHQKSLGVGAFSQRQQQAILDEIEKLRRQDDSLEEFFDRNKPEPFFVKNLETIQGDERDVILLSVGYGKQRPEERLNMNFGPLNREGGWRRLNVLITRAREKCVVFSSIRAEDFDLGATSARGVHALKGYLEYVFSGRMPEIELGDGDFDSPFERAVYNALTAKGISLHRQVGCVGFSIDLAVVDPEKPGKYILGIECDGATYHSATTARDRDRLRQQVLEGLGWRIHRIWSTDWFKTPQREVERVLEAIKKAQGGQLHPCFKDLSGSQIEIDFTEESESPQLPPVLTEPYEYFVDTKTRFAEEFYIAPLETIAEVIVQIVDCEGPIHQEELARRVAMVWDMRRAGARVQKKVKQALNLALSDRQIKKKHTFLWPKTMEKPPIRRRDSEGIRDIALICEEEIGQAAYLLLLAQFGMSKEDLLVQTARILGFGNTGPKISERIEKAIDAEISAGRIFVNGDGLLKAVKEK